MKQTGRIAVMAYVSTKLHQEFRVDRIVTIHYFEYAKSFAFRGEAHDFWELLYVDKGTVEVQAGTEFHTLHRGNLIFHQPMEFHSVKACENVAPNLAVMSFICHSPAMERFQHSIFNVDEAEKSLLSRIILEARRAFSSPLNLPNIEQVRLNPAAPFGGEQLILLYLEQLLIYLSRRQEQLQHMHKSATNAPAPMPLLPPENASESDIELLKHVLSYLSAHICEHLTVPQISGAMLISRSCLQDLSHRVLGCGIIQHFNRMKVAMAKRFIRDDGQTSAQISELLAFGSPSYFARCFKKEVGMTPREYEASVNRISGEISQAAVSPVSVQSSNLLSLNLCNPSMDKLIY